MNGPLPPELLEQHLIDPEICIRCNTCEETCPVDAITHDSRNYVVDASICNACMACISPCPTGAIDNWRVVARADPYPVDAQLGWDVLPPAAAARAASDHGVPEDVRRLTDEAHAALRNAVRPRSAGTPSVNLYTPSRPAIATVTGNFRLTAEDAESDVRHIVLDLSGLDGFHYLEGQSLREAAATMSLAYSSIGRTISRCRLFEDDVDRLDSEFAGCPGAFDPGLLP